MHLAYSALNQLNEEPQTTKPHKESNITIRYNAHIATCEKFHREITAIRQYLPNWQPVFNY
jgi:hypothetical protein